MNFYASENEFFTWVCTKDSQWGTENEVKMIRLPRTLTHTLDIPFPQALLSKVVLGAKAGTDFP